MPPRSLPKAVLPVPKEDNSEDDNGEEYDSGEEDYSGEESYSL